SSQFCFHLLFHFTFFDFCVPAELLSNPQILGQFRHLDRGVIDLLILSIFGRFCALFSLCSFAIVISGHSRLLHPGGYATWFVYLHLNRLPDFGTVFVQFPPLRWAFGSFLKHRSNNSTRSAV